MHSSNIDWCILKSLDILSKRLVFGFMNHCQSLLEPSESILFSIDTTPALVKNLCLIFYHRKPEHFMIDNIIDIGYDDYQQIEYEQVDDECFIFDNDYYIDDCLKYDKYKRKIICKQYFKIPIRGYINIFHSQFNENDFCHWWSFKILRCNSISIGIINRNNNELYMLSSIGTMDGKYFNNGYTTNDIVDMFIDFKSAPYFSSDPSFILLYFSINGERKNLKEIEYEERSIYNMVVYVDGAIELLNYSFLYNMRNKEKGYGVRAEKSLKYVPKKYKCFKCGAIGKHWITDC